MTSLDKGPLERTADLVLDMPDGSRLFYSMVCFGGVDEDGEYEVVLEGPAKGEKVYYE